MIFKRTTRLPGRALRAAAVIGLAAALVAAVAPCVRAQAQPASPSATLAAQPASAAKKTSSKKHHHSRREPSQKAPTPERISEIQSALSRNGFYDAHPNGKWDSSSVAAMQKFQSANGLDPTGKLDALSLQKLGLGSEIAGVSAPETPHPAPPASQKPAPTAPAATPAPPQPQKPDASAPAPSNPQS
jgi:peptidoglycan hydrolase-like protein with peptidoglycan-binding domain